MFVFSKKHFSLILLFLFVSFSFCIAKENVMRNYEITQVTAPPVNERVIVIDAGHRTEKTEGL